MSSMGKSRKSTTSRRSFLKGSAAIGAAVGASSIGMPFVHAAETIKIGVVLPFSGGLEIYAEQDIHGVEMAVKEANEAGGALGRQILDPLHRVAEYLSQVPVNMNATGVDALVQSEFSRNPKYYGCIRV